MLLKGLPDSEGRGGHFHFAACLPFAPWKFRKFVKFQQFLIDFQQIPAIPAKFRENFNEKYDILTDFEQNFAKSGKIINFCKILQKSKKNWVRSGAKDWKSCRSQKTLKNEYLVAKFGFDTAENEPSKVLTCLPASPPLPTKAPMKPSAKTPTFWKILPEQNRTLNFPFWKSPRLVNLNHVKLT